MTLLIKRHPLAAYFGLAYAITWIAILVVWSSGVFKPASMEQLGATFLAMLAGPSAAGLLLTAISDGRAGLRDLWARLTCWRLPAGWYSVMLIMPTLVVAVLAALSALASPAFTPGLMGLGLVYGLLAGYCEEVGWTGFALPRLLAGRSPLAAGLLLGALWGLWHALADFSMRGMALGWLWVPVFLTFALSVTAYRSLMAWVYAHTRSALLAQLMHFAYTGSLALFGPVTTPGNDLLWTAIVAAALWLIVGVLAVVTRREALPRTVKA